MKQSYVIVGTETTSGTPLQGQNNHMNMITAYLVVRAKTYSVSTNGLAALEGGVLIPAMLRFSVDAEDSYRLEEYWTPSTEGYVNDEFNHDEVIDKFPAEVAEKALDTDEYVAQLNQICDSKALAYLDKIENSVHQALIDTLASMLRIPVCMHNVPEEKIFRPSTWSAFGMDKEGADYRACANFGPVYK